MERNRQTHNSLFEWVQLPRFSPSRTRSLCTKWRPYPRLHDPSCGSISVSVLLPLRISYWGKQGPTLRNNTLVKLPLSLTPSVESSIDELGHRLPGRHLVI
ncbi:hypothetical protein BDV30DRAFT_169885 [Aspergillus minisclerotigenes]|uniref:Uncharacterized protein n=1 Tax=Aspergillus minisclerotigenes TaxID=656917 RepID=A0A5N6JJK3_9EURO|nr:hypothetical protein BDV30DRAFT_169885 [Aspergillus minisclerotigenes]